MRAPLRFAVVMGVLLRAESALAKAPRIPDEPHPESSEPFRNNEKIRAAEAKRARRAAKRRARANR